MKQKYIQLPPLPMDMPVEAIEMIWIYISLSKPEQEMIRAFIKENLREDNKNVDKTEFSKALQKPGTEINPDVKEYTDLMKELVGDIDCAVM